MALNYSLCHNIIFSSHLSAIGPIHSTLPYYINIYMARFHCYQLTSKNGKIFHANQKYTLNIMFIEITHCHYNMHAHYKPINRDPQSFGFYLSVQIHWNPLLFYKLNYCKLINNFDSNRKEIYDNQSIHF